MKTKAQILEAALAAKKVHDARKGVGTLHRTIEVEIDRDELAARRAFLRAAKRAITPPNPGAPPTAAEQDDAGTEFDEKFKDKFTGDPALAETLPISLSSEAPVKRYDPWEDEEYDEVLQHSDDAIDMSRTRGMPFLVEHNSRDYSAHVGTLENVRLDRAEKKLRADVRFSRRAEAQACRCDMEDGVRSKISVGYNIDSRATEILRPETNVENARTRVTHKRWTPLEASSVAIPADDSVGVGRSYEGWTPEDLRALRAAIQEMRDEPTHTAGNGQGASMTPPASASPDVKVVRAEIAAENARILELCKTHGMEKEGAEWMAGGLSENDVRKAILEKIKDRSATPIASAAAVQLTERERAQYSMKRGVQTLINAIDGKRGEHKSFETEISDELEKKRPEGLARKGGLLVPICTDPEVARMHNLVNDANVGAREALARMQMRAGLDSLTSGHGAELKFKVPGEFLELLRNFMAVYSAGASYVTGLQGPVAYPQQIGAATATWVAEDPGSDVADSLLTLQLVNLTPNTIQASTSYSRQLWIQSVIDIDAAVKQDLALITAIALDLAAIAGTGASNQPTGILNWAGTSSYAEGTNGATPTYADLVNIETLITAANADQWPLSYLIHPTSRGTFKKAVPLSSTVGLPVFTDSSAGAAGNPALQAGGTSRKRGEMNGYPAWTSAQVPNNLTKGTSSGICLAGVFGAFPTLVIGDWGMFEIIVDPYRLKKQGMIELTSFAMYGVALKFAAAFAVVKDLLA